MIIFGTEYQFIEKERIFLEKKFKNIRYIEYENSQQDKAIEYLKSLILEVKPSFVVLNIGTTPTDKIV